MKHLIQDTNNLKTLSFEDVKSCLKTRRDNCYYFKFPGIEDITLIVEMEGLVKFHPENIRKKMAIIHAYEEYKKVLENE